MWHAWGRIKIVQGFGEESPKKRDHLEDQGLDWRVGSERILWRMDGGVEWIQLA
jgi:hypothetical protein